MIGEPCCPGKSVVKKISVGGQMIGISFLDRIIAHALELKDLPEDEQRSRMLKELKVYNYVPSSAEDDYLEAVWAEYLKELARSER